MYICTMEIFKDIKGYEGLYQVSNFGRVKSFRNGGHGLRKEGKLLKPSLCGHKRRKYLKVGFTKDGKMKTFNVHQLVAMMFLGHTPDGTNKVCVDHRDNNQLNNRVDNLQLVSNRENTSKDREGTSKYTGVSWYKDRNKWIAQIKIDGKSKHLGYFEDEYEAHLAYQNKLYKIK